MKIAKRGLRKARVVLARRLAVFMHAMLRDGTLMSEVESVLPAVKPES